MSEALALGHELVELRLREPVVISRGSQETAEVLRVSLTWGAITGYGEAAPQEEDGQTIASATAFLDSFADQLGDDPFALEEIGARMRRLPGESAAKAAIDAALHDLCGKLLEQPTWRLLGLRSSGPPTSMTISLGVPDEMAAKAQAALDRFPGLRLMKLKLGAGDGQDLDRTRAVASATGLPLTVDVNEGWGLDQALELIPALAELGVRAVEQPLPRHSTDGATLKLRSTLPIYVDEDCYTLEDVAPCVSRAHGINIKLVKCGGIREALRMIHAAQALGLKTMLGCMAESGLGIAAATQISSLVDGVDLDAHLILERDPAPGVELVDGVQTASSTPGLGVSTIGGRERGHASSPR
jgi:L-alanine-DL-glutamate epimerase-like enolase superfamily enzyme